MIVLEACRNLSWPNRDFQDAVAPRAEEIVSLDDLIEFESCA